MDRWWRPVLILLPGYEAQAAIMWIRAGSVSLSESPSLSLGLKVGARGDLANPFMTYITAPRLMRLHWRNSAYIWGLEFLWKKELCQQNTQYFCIFLKLCEFPHTICLLFLQVPSWSRFAFMLTEFEGKITIYSLELLYSIVFVVVIFIMSFIFPPDKPPWVNLMHINEGT